MEHRCADQRLSLIHIYLAAILVALAKEEEKTHGPTRLTRLLRSGEELKLLPIKSEDLRQFRRLAKEYGILFCPIKNKSLDNLSLIHI